MNRVPRFSFKQVLCLVVALALLAGCASSTPAPIRQSTMAPKPAPIHGATAPPAPGPLAAAPQVDRMHVVRPGDTLMGIGRMYGQHVNDLAVWNNLTDRNQLRVGQSIHVSRPGTSVAAAGAVAQPIAIQPAMPHGGTNVAPVKHEPRGGRQPYSDQAWAAINPGEIRPAAVPPPPAAEPQRPVPPRDSAWLWPASGPVIETFDEANNKGVDIAGNPGDPVVASAAGKVVYSGSGLRGYGRLVIIKHNDDYLTAYAHNQNLLVKEGDDVTRGQRIAELGSSDADRPKLHFEIRRQGRPVDPMQYLPAR
jgi:lipoprotein NlpD